MSMHPATSYMRNVPIYMFKICKKLQANMPSAQFNDFTIIGYCIIRKSNKYWKGIWSDLCIESTLMRLMKSIRGLTHGRGVTSSVLQRWVLGMPVMLSICQSLENYTNILSESSAQHKELRESRIKRNITDVEKLLQWLTAHFPFSQVSTIMSLSSRLQGDETVIAIKLSLVRRRQCKPLLVQISEI